MLKAFSNLNDRFQTLINHSSVLFKIADDRRNSRCMEDFYREIIERNRNRLLSLHIQSNLLAEISFDASFSRLEFLELHSFSMRELRIDDLYHLNSLPRLYFVYLCLNGALDSEVSQILCLILSLPVLKRFIVLNRYNGLRFVLRIELPTAINSKSSSIEYLKIENAASVRAIISLLKRLPSLHHLSCGLFSEFDHITSDLETIHLPHLKRLSIRNDLVDFDHLETLIKSIGHHVEIFKLEETFDENYLDAERWKRLIEKFLPRLKVFEMECLEIGSTYIGLIYDAFRPFFSPFWTERGWLPSFSFNLFSMEFHIRPYK